MKNKITKYYLITLLCVLFAVTTVSFADFADGEPQYYIAQIIQIIFPILKAAGYIILIWGVGKFILAMQYEHQEDKVTYILQMILGICLIFSNTLLAGVLRAAGYTGSL